MRCLYINRSKAGDKGVRSFVLYSFTYTPSLSHILCPLIHTVSGLLQVGVQELSSCLVEEVTVTRGTVLSVIRFPDVHSEAHLYIACMKL